MNPQNSNSSIRWAKSKRGSTIAAVMILSIALILILASQLNRGVNERQLIILNKLIHETRNAAESYAEYGHADLIRRFVSRTTFPMNELKTNPITVPSSSSSFYSTSNIDLTRTEVKGGIIPDGYWLYLNPTDPRWEFDPLKGKKVFVREIEVFSKATGIAAELNNKEVTSYVSQVLQVRDSPLFSNAMFYNMDFEIHPGPTMSVTGPVHSNKDAWLMAVDGLTFYDTFSAAGNIRHGSKQYQYTGAELYTGPVKFLNDEGSTVSMKQGSNWVDSLDSNWRTQSSQLWDGNVQDSAHNVPVLNPIGIHDYVHDNPATNADESENYAYALIEPLLPTSHVDVKSDGVRNEKFAAKAGLIFKVTVDSSTSSGYRVSAYKYDRINDNVPVNPLNPFDGNIALDSSGNPVLIEVELPDGVIGASNYNINDIETDGEAEIYEYSGGYVTAGLYDHRQDKEISLISIDIAELRKAVDDNANSSGTDLGATYWADSSGDATYDPTKDWNGVIYVEFPIEANAGSRVDDIVKGDLTNTITTTTPETTWEWEWIWTGYRSGYWTQVPVTTYVTTTTTTNIALQLIDGEKVPAPSFTADRGFTVATNAPLYVVGNFNANGVAHTNDSSVIETNHYTNNSGGYIDEPPVALISDALTILSEDWAPTGRNNRKYSAQSHDGNRDAPTFTEVSTAILTGLTPTIPEGTVSTPSNGARSGGAHNFPRFLEDWDGTLTLRTSMVALFESEIQTKPMPYNYTHFYHPPVRDWGFNDNFYNGYYPPGTPNIRTFRRLKFKDITETEYLAATSL